MTHMKHVDFDFRKRLQAGNTLIGSMLKTPTSQAAEILSDVGFDFVVVDQEHSPFDRASVDLVLLAGRAARIPVLVRVSGPDAILPACDGGAEGVIVPHVGNSAYAERIAASCRYRNGSRGYATSTRAGGFTSIPMEQHIQESDARIAVIAQIEDPNAVREVDSIASVTAIDSLFVGRNDIACSMGCDSVDAPPVREAVQAVAKSARSAGKAFGVFVSSIGELEWLRTLGATMIIVSSDHGFLRAGATKALAEARNRLGNG
jgi:staphyloferrin B biosynthesis citrate synthase